MPPVVTLAVVVYRAAMHFYPPDFRREFGGEMTRDFALGSQEAWGERGWPGLVRLWIDLAADFTRTVAAQWLRSERAAVALVPPVIAVMALRVAAGVLGGVSTDLHVDPADRDLLVLMLLVIVVLLIVVSTIVFTLWFSRPLLHRRRI